MQHEPVAWLEGMLLRPHHLQAAERHIAENARLQVSFDHGYSYGLRRVVFSREAIANGQFELGECEARFRDGTVVSLAAGQEPDRVGLGDSAAVPQRDLSGAFESDETIDVFLAIPKLRLGRANVSPERGGQQRYVGLAGELPDENGGGNEQEVSQRTLNVQILLGTDNLAGYETLPLARIKRAGAAEAAPELDGDYIPPLLACDAWPELARDYVRAVYDTIGHKIEVLSAQVISRGIMQGSAEAGDLHRLLMLTALNAGFGALRSLAFARGVHPHVVYTELCRIVGSLSIFRQERRPVDVPTYDHDDLAKIFRWARDEIRSLITEVQEYRYERRDFIGVGRGMEVALDAKWMGRDWDWFIGVHHQGIGGAECRELLLPGRLDWKLGSSEKVDFMFRFRRAGLEKQLEETSAPRALPQSAEWLFYRVKRSGPAWEELQAQDSPTLAVRFKEDLIANLEQLVGVKELQIRTEGVEGTLRLSLFAVPQSPSAT